jgi:hypothetical protein
MSEKPETIETAEEEFDAIMPDGWTGADGADIFDPATWGSAESSADASDAEPAEGDGNSTGGTEARTRTTEESEDPQISAAEDSAPTTGGEPNADNVLRFQADVDHVRRDVELNIADLPTVYQKSLALDRYQKRASEQETDLAKWDALASGLNFENREALYNGLIENAVQDYIAEHPSIPEEMARDFVMRRFQSSAKPEKKPAEPSAAEVQAQPQTTRDYRQEVADLFRAYPGARAEKIPDEVTNAAIRENKPLVQAYADWKAKSASAEAARAARENKILKQNQAAAAKAPVRKVTGGGGTSTSPDDDFLKGFNDDSAW